MRSFERKWYQRKSRSCNQRNQSHVLQKFAAGNVLQRLQCGLKVQKKGTKLGPPSNGFMILNVLNTIKMNIDVQWFEYYR
jgi:hypothetical protein